MIWFILSALLGVGGVVLIVKFGLTARVVWLLGAIVSMGLAVLVGFFLAPEAWSSVGSWAAANEGSLSTGIVALATVIAVMAMVSVVNTRRSRL